MAEGSEITPVLAWYRACQPPLTHAALSHWLYRVSGSAAQNDAAADADFGAAFGI